MSFMGELWKTFTGQRLREAMEDNRQAHERLRRTICAPDHLDAQFDDIDRILKRLGGENAEHHVAGQR